MPIDPSTSLNVAVLTISDTRTEENDASGRFLISALTEAGHHLHTRRIVRDNRYQIQAIVTAWIADETVHVILTTGSTGFTGRDTAPEAIRPLLDKRMPGFGELFRALSYAEIGTSSLQSRALAGLANDTFVFVLPGSTGACRTAWEKLIRAQLDSRTRPCNLVQLIPRLNER